MVPLLVAVATSLTALAGAVCWCRILRRALIRERVAARLGQGVMARDMLALEELLERGAAERERGAAERDVLAVAAAIVDAAALQHQASKTDRKNEKGGGDA